jgi:O-antigen/teichoic acid export membrane protein
MQTDHQPSSAIRRNLGWLLLSQGATWTISIVVLLVAPRQLGDGGFGQLTFAQVYVGLFELVAIFGTGTFLAKTLARETESTGRYVVNTLILKAFSTSALIVCALALAAALGYPTETLQLIAAFCVGLFFSTLNTVLMGSLQGLQRMGRPALWEVIRCYAGATLGLAVLFNGGGVLAYALVINIVCVIPALANFVNLWPEMRRSMRFEPGLWREVLVGGFPFFILSAFTVIYATIDIPLLEALSGHEAVGWYGLAYRWVSVPVFFASTVSYAYFPALSVHGVGDRIAFAQLANRALSLTFLVAAPAALGMVLIAPDFLDLLYGAEFENAVPLMQLLALHIPLVALDLMLGSIVIAVDRQRPWVLLSVIAAVLNPLFNLVAIPLTERAFDNGAIGAASITILTELFIFVGALRLRPAGVLDRPTALVFGRVVVAALAMVPVVVALGGTPLAVRIIAGAITYGIASLALGTISLRELRGIGTELVTRQARSTVAS